MIEQLLDIDPLLFFGRGQRRFYPPLFIVACKCHLGRRHGPDDDSRLSWFVGSD